jgi:phage baseplate assembly protein gpV
MTMRQFYDLAGFFSSQIMRAEEEAGRVFEPMIGIVTDNKDPQKLGRVKVKLPVLSERDTTWWAPIIMMGAGKNRGWFFIPEVDDEVLVMFEHGDIDRPIVVGALWSTKDKPPDKNPGGNPRRVIKSRAGSKIVFDDEEMKLVIEDGGGKGRITFDANANKIVIEALEGDVCFQAPNGEMQIVAESVELKAGSNIEIHAGGAMRWGTDGSATIDGGSSMTLSGAKVNINCGIAQAPPAPTADPRDVPDPYEARGDGRDGNAQAASNSVSSAATSSSSASAASSAPSAASASPAAAPAAAPLETEPPPLVVAARWERARVPASTEVKLRATCSELAGQTATFTIKDADTGEVVATVTGGCDASAVEATWKTPPDGPPALFTFEVEAGGKSASSDMLTLVKRVEAKLMLDDEPAADVRVKLRSEETGELLSGTADDKGLVVFEEAPLGEHTLLLEEET